MQRFVPFLLSGLVLAPTVAAARPIVVELFTSEGCSSCPPADVFLNELARERRDLLPLAFHVTYWNSLGWRDPFSLEASTSRQTGYSDHFGGNSVFTPQMVVDGARSLVGSSRGEAASAFEAAKSEGETAAAMRVSRENGRLSVHVGQGSGRGEVLLVGFDHEHRTAVGRGENSGRTLVESNIVRSIRPIGSWTGAAMTLSEDAPSGEDAAVLLQAPDGRIIGAARLGATS